jgi:hypothetical protein
MNKTQLMDVLADQELSIIKHKQHLQDQIDDCFHGHDLVDQKTFDDLIKKFEFANGQQTEISNLVEAFKLNKNKYYDLVNQKYDFYLVKKHYQIV